MPLWNNKKYFVLPKNLTIFNIILWVDGTIVSSTKRVLFQVFFFISSFKKFSKNSLNLFFYFLMALQIKSFECPKSKPATHCFILIFYQNNTWTIRPLVDERIDAVIQCIILKIVGFQIFWPNTVWHSKPFRTSFSKTQMSYLSTHL